MIGYKYAIGLIEAAALELNTLVTVDKGAQLTQTHKKDTAYPLVFIELDTLASLTFNSETFPLAFEVLDKVEDVKENYLNTLDKTHEMAKSVIANIYKLDQKGLFSLTEDLSATLASIVGGYPDNVIGWRVELTIQTKASLDQCYTL